VKPPLWYLSFSLYKGCLRGAKLLFQRSSPFPLIRGRGDKGGWGYLMKTYRGEVNKQPPDEV